MTCSLVVEGLAQLAQLYIRVECRAKNNVRSTVNFRANNAKGRSKAVSCGQYVRAVPAYIRTYVCICMYVDSFFLSI